MNKVKREISYDPVFELHLAHSGHLLWLREMTRLRDAQPPYDCHDDEALKRFESILKSGEKKQIVKRLNSKSNVEKALTESDE